MWPKTIPLHATQPKQAKKLDTHVCVSYVLYIYIKILHNIIIDYHSLYLILDTILRTWHVFTLLNHTRVPQMRKLKHTGDALPELVDQKPFTLLIFGYVRPVILFSAWKTQIHLSRSDSNFACFQQVKFTSYSFTFPKVCSKTVIKSCLT